MTTTPGDSPSDAQPHPQPYAPFAAPPAPPPPSSGERAAGQIAEFSRLFEERRAAEAAAPGTAEREPRNLRAMDALAPAVQRYLEFVGRSWINGPVEHERPMALTYVLAYGARGDYEPIAVESLAQLRHAEAAYRAGEVDLRTESRRRSRGRWRRTLGGSRVRIGALVLAAFVLYAAVLANCGSWVGERRIQPASPVTLTMTERTF